MIQHIFEQLNSYGLSLSPFGSDILFSQTLQRYRFSMCTHCHAIPQASRRGRSCPSGKFNSQTASYVFRRVSRPHRFVECAWCRTPRKQLWQRGTPFGRNQCRPHREHRSLPGWTTSPRLCPRRRSSSISEAQGFCLFIV